MSDSDFIEQLTSHVEKVPEVLPVLSLATISVEDVADRMRRLLTQLAAATGLTPRIGDPRTEEDRTLFRLPDGGLLVGYHGSGALAYRSGVQPMDNLIGSAVERDELERSVREAADRLDLSSWIGEEETLEFERLWQIKARAEDRKGTSSETVVCRAIGAFRHMVADTPVLGAASVAVHVAAKGELDAIDLLARPTNGETIDEARIVSPEEGARRILQQLAGLIPERGRLSFSDIAKPKSFRLGYVSLGKRKAQPVLAPAYVAEVETGGEERMSYLAMVHGTDKEYLPLFRVGETAPGNRRSPQLRPTA